MTKKLALILLARCMTAAGQTNLTLSKNDRPTSLPSEEGRQVCDRESPELCRSIGIRSGRLV
jgi:hypothetical protein